MQPRLFKDTGNADEFKKYLPVNVNTSFKTLYPYFGYVEENYIKPLLGTALYEQLATMYESDALTPEYSQLLDYVRYSEINLAYYSGFSILSINLSDGGASTKAKEGDRLYRYQEDNAKEHFKSMGFNNIDTTLNYLYDNITIFDLFTQSEFYKQSQKTLIPDTKTLNDVYNIQNSRLVFLKMRQYIAIVEDIELRHFFGDAFIQELLNNDLTSDKYSSIASYIRKYIVYMALYHGIEELGKIPTERGLIFYSLTPDDGYKQQPVENKEVKEMKAHCKLIAERYLSTAIDYLKMNGNEYTGYSIHATKNTPNITIQFRKNKGKKTFFLPTKI
jgi:hypothetical protein